MSQEKVEIARWGALLLLIRGGGRGSDRRYELSQRDVGG
jgi:hypothetical protein